MLSQTMKSNNEPTKVSCLVIHKLRFLYQYIQTAMSNNYFESNIIRFTKTM